nr:uncharacterized protein LOC127339862 [Lolium perenne]
MEAAVVGVAGGEVSLRWLAEVKNTDRAKPRYHPDNLAAWNNFFLRRWEQELAAYDVPPPPPPRNNVAGRKRWWSVPGRTLEAVLEHIEGGNFPIPTMPPLSRVSPARRRKPGSPRRMAASSSSSGSAARSISRSAPSSWAPVKNEPSSPPSNRARGGGIVIREPSTAQGRRRPKGEPDTSSERKRKPAKVKVEEAESVEYAAILEAIMARSLQDLVPAENSMPLDQGTVTRSSSVAARPPARAFRSLSPSRSLLWGHLLPAWMGSGKQQRVELDSADTRT